MQDRQQAAVGPGAAFENRAWQGLKTLDSAPAGGSGLKLAQI